VILAIEAFETFKASSFVMSSVLPSNFDVPSVPFGLPHVFPDAFTAASASFVRKESNSRSISAKRLNIVTITLV
jgi:hypothetical protein